MSNAPRHINRMACPAVTTRANACHFVSRRPEKPVSAETYKKVPVASNSRAFRRGNWGQQWEPQHAVLHRWYQRRDGRAVWRHKYCSRPNRRCRTSGPDLRLRWPSRLVATAEEDRLSFRQQRSRFMSTRPK
jgi:hypothetical protein